MFSYLIWGIESGVNTCLFLLYLPLGLHEESEQIKDIHSYLNFFPPII